MKENTEENEMIDEREAQKAYMEYLIYNNRSNLENWDKVVMPKWKNTPTDIQIELISEVMPILYLNDDVFAENEIDLYLDMPVDAKLASIESIMDKFIGPEAEKYVPNMLIKAIGDLIACSNPEIHSKIVEKIISNFEYIPETINAILPTNVSILENVVTNVNGVVLERFAEDIASKLDTIRTTNPEVNTDIVFEKRPDIFYTKEFWDRKSSSMWADEFDVDLEENPTNIKKFISYIKYAISENKYATTDDRFVGQMQQLMLNSDINHEIKKYMSLEERKELKDIFNSLRTLEPEPDMSKYEDKVTSFTDMSEDEFEQFSNDLRIFRNINGRFPEKYCDYIMRVALDQKAVLNRGINEYRFQDELIKRVFEDKAQHVLAAEGINNFFVVATSNLDENTYGQCDYENKVVKMDEQKIKWMNQFDSSAINTLFHECRHAVKDTHIDKGTFKSGIEYKILKEEILSEIDEDFYYENYEYMLSEIDARITGTTNQVKLLKKMGLSDMYILDELGRSVIKIFKDEVLEEHEKKDTTVHKKDFGEDEEFVNRHFSKKLLENPQFIADYPILELEYEKDGRRKPGIEILKSYENAIEEVREDRSKAEASHVRLFPYILKDVVYIQNEQALGNIDLLADYEPTSKTMRKYRDMIIRREVLEQFDEWKKEGGISLDSKPNQSVEEKQVLLQEAAKKLDEFAKTHPDEDISKEISEKIEGVIERETKVSVNDLEEIDRDVSQQERNNVLEKLKQLKKEENLKDVSEDLEK